MNTFIGAHAGDFNGNSEKNTFIGALAGEESIGDSNIFIDIDSGWQSKGSGNIFLGNHAGFGEVTDNTLIIEDYDLWMPAPLMKGDFATGKVGIAVNNFPTTAGSVDVSNYKFFVQGGILAEEIRVATTWADYVFENNYKLPTLKEVEQHITDKGHLINVPSAKEVEENGISLGEIAKIQQEKIEELTL